MKYGAGSALLSELIARSSSCCSVCSNTGSLAPAAAVCASTAGTADTNSSRQRKYDFRDDMANRKCTSSVGQLKCYVRLPSKPVVGLPDFSPQRTLRTQREQEISKPINNAFNPITKV